MGSIKRKRDTEYTYEEQQNRPVPSSTTPQNSGMTAQVSQGPFQWQTNDHVQNLLAQAKLAGLLPANGPGVPGVPPAYPPTTTAYDPSNYSPWNGQGRVDARRPLPRYGQTRDPRLPQHLKNPQNPNAKRRKLNTNNKRSPQKPRAKKSKPPPKPGQKPPAGTGDEKLVDLLIAEAQSARNEPDIPSYHSIPKFPDIKKPDNYPPPLPPIHNKDLEQQCFTHVSYIHDPMNKQLVSSTMHYERLEFLGDSYMNYCVTKILYTRLPDIREGELTRFRSQIISNDNIRHYAIMYGFPERILLSSGAEKDEVRETGKKVADIFEAYIGGILTDQPEDGERVVREWMEEIIGPQLTEAEKISKMILNVNKNAKQELYVLIDAEKVPAPTYVVTKAGATNSDFEVACIIQGKELGRGLGKNKNEAGTRAAMQVLEKLRAHAAKKTALKESALPEDIEGDKLESGGTMKQASVNEQGEDSSDESVSEGEISVSSDD
jgi:dsRNA-specific ribonuclease